MPDRAAITAAVTAGGLAAEDVDWLFPAIKQAAIYTENVGQFPELEADLRALIGDVADYRGPYIKATIEGFEQLGDNQVELAGGREAVFFDLAANRDLMARLVLNILYDDLSLRLAAYTISDTAIGIMYGGRCGVCYCLPCACWPRPVC